MTTPATPPDGRLLLVDDDPAFLRSAARLVRSQGWAVSTAASGEEALSRLDLEEFDGMVLDLHMAPTDGLAVLELAQQRRRLPPTVLLTGRADTGSTVRAIQYGAIDVVEKPAPIEDVLSRLASSAVPRARSDAADELLGESAPIRLVRDQIRSVARFTDVPVLVLGETGTGKELVARALHGLMGAHTPLVTLNCSAIPETLFESELFGHVAGAFTGATSARPGLLEATGDGVLFLDEVGEMPASLQAKLLRVLETRQFRRVGGQRLLNFRGRIVSATNRLTIGGESGLRSDLYYRLAGFTIVTPPLRRRKADIEILAKHFLTDFSVRHDAPGRRLSPNALEALLAHEWPGNVRELRGVVRHAAIVSAGPEVRVSDIAGVLLDHSAVTPGQGDTPPSMRAVRGEDGAPVDTTGAPADAAGAWTEADAERPSSATNLRALEREVIRAEYARHQGNVTLTAQHLGIPRSTLRGKLKRLGLR